MHFHKFDLVMNMVNECGTFDHPHFVCIQKLPGCVLRCRDHASNLKNDFKLICDNRLLKRCAADSRNPIQHGNLMPYGMLRSAASPGSRRVRPARKRWEWPQNHHFGPATSPKRGCCDLDRQKLSFLLRHRAGVEISTSGNQTIAAPEATIDTVRCDQSLDFPPCLPWERRSGGWNIFCRRDGLD